MAQSNTSSPAGLNRISHADGLGSNGYVFDNSSGSGIVAYVVDTGIMTTHSVSATSHIPGTFTHNI